MKLKELMAADLFCGGGGTSTGLANLCKKKGIKPNLLAINHWKVAIETHTAAHPWAKHIQATLDHVKPREAVPGGRLHVLVASPECTSHSRARGGRPKDDQSRATAWDILKWCQELYVDKILIENVEEFMEWGPLGADLKPLKSRKGETFRAFIAALRALGYTVEYRILNAADYGAPTSRKRLFIIGRRDRKAIVWPQATHSKHGGRSLFGTTKKYRAARECINWEHKGTSIFSRKKPLKDTTLNRILVGMEKYNPALEPFLVILRNNMATRSLNEPMPTITAGGKHIGLAEPFLTRFNGSHAGKEDGANRNLSLDEPITTIDTSNRFGVVEPVLVNMKGKSTASSIDSPTPTQTTRQHQYLAQPIILPQFGEGNAKPATDPFGTFTTTSRGIGIVDPVITPLILGQQSCAAARPVDSPMPTIAKAGAISVIEPILVTTNHGKEDKRRSSSIKEPMQTVTKRNGLGIAEGMLIPPGMAYHSETDTVGRPYMIPFFGEAKGQKPRSHSVDVPMPAVTSHGAGGLVTPLIVPIDNKSSGASGAKSVDDPLTTITCEARHAVAEPFLTKYYGTAHAASVDEPLDTVTTKARFGLVMPEINGYRLDILFRMVQPDELAAAMTFPPKYPFFGTKEQVTAQIGNAVPPDLAEAILTELLNDYVPA